jgi:hypothetical protein
MTKKKKILLFTLLGMVLMTSCYGYYLWDRNKKTQAVIAWVIEQGGNVDISHPEWIDKWPKFTQKMLKGITQSNYAIRLSRTKVIDISVLNNLTNLQELYLSDTEVSKEQIEELQKKLPKLTIRYSHTHD